MKLVAAALGNDANLPARATPELSRGHAGLHRELLNRVGNAEVAQRRVDLGVDVADAIEQEYVGLRARPGDIEAAALCARCRGQNAWSQKCQVQILARVQRHVRNNLAIHYTAKRTSVRFQ